MKRRVVFTPAARAEVIAAQEWYEGEAPGLGARFRGEVDFAVQRLSGNPLQFPVILASASRLPAPYRSAAERAAGLTFRTSPVAFLRNFRRDGGDSAAARQFGVDELLGLGLPVA